MGPNAAIKKSDAPRDGKGSGHHYHVKLMQGTYAEAAKCCGDMAKEEGCPVCVCGELPESNQGDRTDFKEAQKIIKQKALEGCKLLGPDGLSELLPRFWAQNEQWVRGLCTCHFKFGDDFFTKNQPFKWQKDLVSPLNDYNPDPRKILFVVNEKVNAGKSEMVRNIRFLFPNKEVFSVPPQDLVSMASLLPDDGVDIVILDCPRQKQCDLPCEFLENLKDGRVMQTKCQPITKSFPPPHVVVIVNRIPKTGKTILSVDSCITKEVELEPEEIERLELTQVAALPEYLSSAVERTREIIEACEEEKSNKQNYAMYSNQ